MQVTQSYARPSTAHHHNDGMQFNFAAETHRNPVNLNALIKNSLQYARIMLALRLVVKGDWRTPRPDHTAYQDWVVERYWEELPQNLKGIDPEKIKLLQKREKLKQSQKQIQRIINPIQSQINKAQREYFKWLYQHDREKWIVLDPVISVHPDAVIFEAFSLDESTYGRVSIPSHMLETFGKTDYGTTNIDFSQILADELYRVRSYRPAWLKVAFEKVEIGTYLNTAIEKKIDLPESWVKGFLQVQSAATLEGKTITLSTSTIADVLAILDRKREKQSPRSLKFILKKGQPIQIQIDPWGIIINDTHHYEGKEDTEVKIWGRRRLEVLKDLLPYSDKIWVKLLGTGMPSYWTIIAGEHRFDLGLSGWTDNDWAKKASFDLLASSGTTEKVDLTQVKNILIQKLAISPEEVSQSLKISRNAATKALQELCKQGQAMYDHLTEQYRWRQLLQQDIQLSPNTEEDERIRYAISLNKENKVLITEKNNIDAQLTQYKATVKGKNDYSIALQLDLDGRVKLAQCTCSFYRRNKLRQGPCQHIIATLLMITKNA